MKRFFFVMAIPWLVAGCGIYGMMHSEPNPTPSQISSANYGPPPDQYREKIQMWYQANLVNPVGLILEHGEPFQAWINIAKRPDAQFPGTYGTRVAYGWAVGGYMNAQNRFGGYSGRDRTYSFFENGQLIYTNWGQPAWEACKSR